MSCESVNHVCSCFLGFLFLIQFLFYFVACFFVADRFLLPNRILFICSCCVM